MMAVEGITLNRSIAILPLNPFEELRTLLSDVTPRSEQLFDVSIGDPRGVCPVSTEIIADKADTWGRYPPLSGTDEFRGAAFNWLSRRFSLREEWLRGHFDLLPAAGTREALFLAAQLCVNKEAGSEPVILLPNPSYPGYLGSAIMSGAEPVLLPSHASSGFLPDLSKLDSEIKSRAALMFFTNPTNPEGASGSFEYLRSLLEESERYGFVIAADECSIDLYTRDKPIGILEACHSIGANADRLLIFNSLSKRSYGAGLRSGFVAGGRKIVNSLRALRSYGGSTVPIPLQAASAALWNDDFHVEAIREDLDLKFSIAERMFSHLGYVRPAGGFFVWLPVKNDLHVARELYRAGVKVMPGSLLGRNTSSGNPGKGYIRIALVHSIPEVEKLCAIISPYAICE